MHIDVEQGRLDAARWCWSPNQDTRPDPAALELLVIHSISLPPGEFRGDAVERLFTNRLATHAHPDCRGVAALRVSAHLLLRRDGSLVQFVAFHRRAWHAGHSCYGRRENCNDFSIGIELEGIDTRAYSDPQYAVLGQVVAVLLNTYPRLSTQRMVGHSDIAPGRKSDPGPAFDWARLHDAVRAHSRITPRPHTTPP